MRLATETISRHLVSGAQYVSQLTAGESDRGARAAFRGLVLRIAQPGATLFDFGCGPGMDARFYAERGFQVRAYDVDPKQCDYFASECHDLIEARRVTLERGSYEAFLARDRSGDPVDLITANFAPLNLIEDLHELFAAFHELTYPGGRVLASVLSPYFVGDLRYPWWWRNLRALKRTGHFSVPGVQAPICRRRLADFAAQSVPYFDLEEVFPGLPARRVREVEGLPVRSGMRRAWLRLAACRFMFLLFARRKTSVSRHRALGANSVSSRNPACSRATEARE
jgi:SAM-dependent methyltransferase